MVKKHFKTVKKILATASVIALFGGVTAFADTYQSDSFNGGDYGQYYFVVNSESGMRSCEAKAWGKSNCEYKVELTTVYYDGQEVVNSIGYNYGTAYVYHSYEWAEDYQVYMAVRHNLSIVDSVTFSGS